MKINVRMRPKAVLGSLCLASMLGPWLWATGHANCHALLSPAHSSEITQEPRELAYPANVDSVVTWPLPQVLKAVPELKGLEPDESQSELPGILQKVGANVKTFFEDFPNTASVERISMEGLGARGVDTATGLSGQVSVTDTQKFQYLALSRPVKGGIGLDEYRTNAKGEIVDPGGLAGTFFVTKGFVSMSVHFHPAYQADSAFRYLGRQVIDKRQTYVVAFAQKPDIAHVVGQIRLEGPPMLVFVQGIAWIDFSSYQIMRLRTDLLKSEEDIGLKKQTTEIEFQTVHFKDSPQVFWLPREVGVTVDWRGNVYRNRHRYSDFKLFTVGTEQKVQTPENAPPGHQNPN